MGSASSAYGGGRFFYAHPTSVANIGHPMGVSMLAFAQAIADAISSISPLVTINPDERGVLVRCGKVKCPLPPGLYWRWPLVDQIDIRSVVDGVAELNTQSLTTRDAKSVAISGRLRYRVADIVKAQYAVYDIDDALVEECEAQIASAVMDRSIPQLLDREDVEEEVLASISDAVDDWGIEALDFSITNLVTCRALRLLQE